MIIHSFFVADLLECRRQPQTPASCGALVPHGEIAITGLTPITCPECQEIIRRAAVDPTILATHTARARAVISDWRGN